MSEFVFKVKLCPVCNQGWIEIVKEEETNNLFLCCSECETEWIEPDNISKENGTQNYFGKITEPTIEEIKSIAWDKYILS